MSSSAALITTHIDHLRGILAEWEQQQSPTNVTDVRDHDTEKDVLVCFRTRPPLPNEATTKFGNTQDSHSETDTPAEYCAGISVLNTEPGKFVAHVPGMRVCDLQRHLAISSTQYSTESGLE